jgi:hypothetical protein
MCCVVGTPMSAAAAVALQEPRPVWRAPASATVHSVLAKQIDRRFYVSRKAPLDWSINISYFDLNC